MAERVLLPECVPSVGNLAQNIGTYLPGSVNLCHAIKLITLILIEES